MKATVVVFLNGAMAETTSTFSFWYYEFYFVQRRTMLGSRHDHLRHRQCKQWKYSDEDAFKAASLCRDNLICFLTFTLESVTTSREQISVMTCAITTPVFHTDPFYCSHCIVFVCQIGYCF
ncbi:uncharacterized protein PHALS_15467 [Plasmopara halstedii]|uniref:Uncharacterized protein n=1 Tax=Plasmopara halstedii TaxID=4781 RepID=A0A0P1AI45_PLAHL|nr:uncharacterized protein PHALS_15467 [Plasmopara halstedii]CEG40690.1 hypothetical protein PHALS_15467 [Plasmopara halstedii]|eukprot:XP_024577059.1 hypothetical protein PHALS_15467 [Plasmopara halstedii]